MQSVHPSWSSLYRQHFLRIQAVPAPAVVPTIAGICIEAKKRTIAHSDDVRQSKSAAACVLGTINPWNIASMYQNWYTTKVLVVDQVLWGHNSRFYCEFMMFWHHFLPAMVVVHAADAQ